MIALMAAVLALSPGVRLHCPAQAVFEQQARQAIGTVDHGAFYTYATRDLTLRPDVCVALLDLVQGERPYGAEARYWGFAVYTLAHELQHANGVYSEAEADCGAGRTFLRVAARLGVGRKLGQRLLRASTTTDGYDPSVFTACV